MLLGLHHPSAGTAAIFGLTRGAMRWRPIAGWRLGLPSWLLGLSPFHQIGLVPAAPFRAGPAAAMLAIGLGAGAAAVALFRRRDLAGA